MSGPPLRVRSINELDVIPAENVMEITVGGGLWHTDCEKNQWKSGVMREVRNEKDSARSLLECLHCGKQGYLPHGSTGRTCCEEVTPNI